MGHSRLQLLVLLGISVPLLGGCGSTSQPKGPPTVLLLLTAPVDGATVNVRNIEVLGSAEPANSVVLVSGHRTRVTNGTFRRSIFLSSGLTRITVVGRARGYVSTTMRLAVRYVPAPGPGPGAGGSAPSGSDGSPLEASFVTECSSQGANFDGCTCVWKQLVAENFDTEAQFKSVIVGWRRSLRATGTLTYPAPLRNAFLACAARFRQ